MLRLLERVGSSSSSPSPLSAVSALLRDSEFRRLVGVHNAVQSVQCFRVPPRPLCADARNLVQDVSEICEGVLKRYFDDLLKAKT